MHCSYEFRNENKIYNWHLEKYTLRNLQLKPFVHINLLDRRQMNVSRSR